MHKKSEFENIAIVGMSCKFPDGVNSVADYWGYIISGKNVAGNIPKERWGNYSIKSDNKNFSDKLKGGFLSEVDTFDAGFFGISPREAKSIDPQQRLLLEVCWESLEHSGLTLSELKNNSVGVFIGLSSQEYGLVEGEEQFDGYSLTGNSASLASGRISHAFGFTGPSITVDTATSSSLVSLHLACQSVLSGESSLALAGGASLMLTPRMFIGFDHLGGLASDGYCKTFSAEADGTGWAEGCGVVVLKRLSDALRDGDAIAAVIRGSAVNHDGHTQGLTVPSGAAQEAVVRAALKQAGVRPADVGYVECHGTGTRLGDPIEVQALGAVLAEGRDAAQPVILGSVKSNIGHTQAAAGVAGLIKTVLALQHGIIPQNLHFATPNPHIPWDQLPVRVAAEATPWPPGDRPRIAGVSSWGLGGTNAHVILEEAPRAADPAGREAPTRKVQLLVLSGRTDAAARGAAQRLAAHLRAHPE
ncbi:type I polyketide synthase, partial [Serratia ficaria]|uniref:type I polyketide synthase n=1 Tax=Serratia ficaria TaxID=61651 RepID=UPI002916C076